MKVPIRGILIISLVLNLILGYQLVGRVQQKTLPYLSPRLFAASKNDVVVNVNSLRNNLKSYVPNLPVKTGVYFEYLPSGTSIGVNEKDIFFSASLIKVPLAMRVYSKIASAELKLDQALTIEERHIDKGSGDLWQSGAGTKKTVDELVDYLLQKSDNTAYRVLLEATGSEKIEENGKKALYNDVFQYLDIPDDQAGGNNGVTPKNYVSILRSLYLSAYLPYTDSNRILETMTGSTFREWLPQPIPADVKVAHKFGKYDAEPKEYSVFSDCGIVYFPKRPYALCVMVNTQNEQQASEIIRNISKQTYDFISVINK